MVTFWGKVKKGHGRGEGLGFPSANIGLNRHILEGIYLSKTKIEGKIYPSLTFVGAAKTFNDTKYHSETYLLDFSGNLYNKWISIRLIKKIRENEKFENAKELVAQMKKDELVAREYFGQLTLPKQNKILV